MAPRNENRCPTDANGNRRRSDCNSVVISFTKTFLKSKMDARKVKEPTKTVDGKKKREGLRPAAPRFEP